MLENDLDLPFESYTKEPIILCNCLIHSSRSRSSRWETDVRDYRFADNKAGGLSLNEGFPVRKWIGWMLRSPVHRDDTIC